MVLAAERLSKAKPAPLTLALEPSFVNCIIYNYIGIKHKTRNYYEGAHRCLFKRATYVECSSNDDNGEVG